MKKYLIAITVSGLMAAGIGVGLAQASPGPNGSNNHGLCTAYFNGQKKGWDKKSSPPAPFSNLESAAESAESSSDDESASNEVASDVYNYCDNGAQIGGNPSQNGRYASCFQSNDTFSC